MSKRAGWLVIPTVVALLVTLMPPVAVAGSLRSSSQTAALRPSLLLPAWASPLARPLSPQALPSPFLSGADVVDAPYGPSPTVDGFIAPGEYAGAGKATFAGYGGEVEVFFRQDATTLYIAFELPDRSPIPPVPSVSIYLDTLNDGGAAPQTDDFRFTVFRNNGAFEWRGNGGGWNASTPITWTWGITETMSGWSVEFGIPFSKLGITAGTFKELGLSLYNGGSGAEYYWPAGADGAVPDSWGSLVSSSDWSTSYWKPGPWADYAPSGLPDFDQKQSNWQKGGKWTHCGPVAAANSLWWFDSKFETPDHGPPTISDTYRLVTSYSPLQWDDHAISNVVPLVDDLANNYFGTNQGITGTNIISMFFGLQDYLRDRGLWDDYLVTLVVSPTYQWVADEVMRGEDVILLLGFWEDMDPGPGYAWHRVGGHYVTVAGVDPVSGTIAFSDPFIDSAEQGGMGRVLSGTLVAHQPIPGHGATIHNDAGNVSHDVYFAVPTNSPGGVWGPDGYPLLEPLLGANPHPEWPTEPYQGGFVQAEVEFALSLSPYTWKASGYWDEDAGEWVPWIDYAPNGVPDFDQKQDNWGPQPAGPPPWTFCGPVAAADSLWWFDSKFEPVPTSPITINDNYPLVHPYGSWDDHDPNNVDNPGTSWPPSPWPSNPPISPGQGELVEDLALYFQTDMLGSGTVITALTAGLDAYLTDHGLRQGYVITQVKSPDFWWVAEEVEVSEDVILLLGFWQWQDPPGEWVRLGGHYVTVPGVDKQGGLVAFSDPFFDHAEFGWPYAYPGGYPYWMGRVADGWLVLPHQHLPNPPDTIHNDAGNISHDVYVVTSTNSPGGAWGPGTYVTSVLDIENFFGQNQEPGPTPSPTTATVQTEVEWAVAVSPVADLWLTKTVTPTAVAPGDWITFVLTFQNVGSFPAEDVVLTDALPSQLINASWEYRTFPTSRTITARPGVTYVWDLPDLAWMEGGVVTVTARVDPSLAWPLSLTLANGAVITTSTTEQYQVPDLPNTAATSFTVQTADLAVTKTVTPTVVVPGDWITFALTFQNVGLSPAEDVVLTDVLPSQLISPSWTYRTFPAGGTIAARPGVTYAWNLPDLAPTEGGVVTVTARVDPGLAWPAVLTLTNGVTIATSSVEPRQGLEASNVATAPFTVQTADLVITKRVAPTDTLSTGDWVTFTLVYTNVGPAPASGVVITDLLPAPLLTPTARFTYTTSYGGRLTATDHYVWQAGGVPAAGWGVITVTAQLTRTMGSRTTNRAIIAGWYDRDVGNNEAERDVALSGATIYLPLVMRNR